MGAVYGILGGADRGELRAIGARLSIAGRSRRSACPAEGVSSASAARWPWWGASATVRSCSTARSTNGRELDRVLGRASGTGEPARDGVAGELWEWLGEEGLALIAGQFALGLWDGARGMVLARDRVGYAPLYSRWMASG